MRPLVAALIGGLAGAVAALSVSAALRDEPAPPALEGDAVARSIERIRARLDQIERTTAPRSRSSESATPVATPAAETQPPELNGHGRHDAETPADERPVDFTKVSTADLALEADERHTRDYDIAGALKRYRELLSRASTPADRRHWLIRVGDCYVRLRHEDEAAEAYRACIDASTEDHGERVGCMIYLARRELAAANASEAMRWLDRAAELQTGRDDHSVHELAADAARELRQGDREIRELQWLVDHGTAPTPFWADRLAQARGEKR